MRPMPYPTMLLATYCMPSKRPAAVAAAFFPPKSMLAAPPIMACGPASFVAGVAGVEDAEPRVLGRVLHEEPVEHEEDREEHRRHPVGPLPGQPLDDQRSAAEGEDEPEADEHAEDTREGPALADV